MTHHHFRPRDVTRRDFLAATVVAPMLLRTVLGGEGTTVGRLAAPSDAIRVASPNRAIELVILAGDASRLRLSASLAGRPVLDASPLALTVDGLDLSSGVQVRSVRRTRRRERYPWRGVKARAVDAFNGAVVTLTHAASGTTYDLELRAFDDGIAFRHTVAGGGTRVPDEATAFVIPAGSTVWYHDLGGHYEASYTRVAIADVKRGDWAAPPLTFQLPDGAGYGSITEAALVNYSGMALQADGDRTFRVRLGHAHPASYPYTLRYGQENAARLATPAAVDGPIATPWRIVLVARDLDLLVNADVVHNVSPPADPQLFPRGMATAWVRPGRAVWKYLDGGGENSLETMKEFSRLAGELGFEYHLVEGFWQRWPEADVRALVDYSRARNVGIWLWKHSRDLRDDASRAAFFATVSRVGAVGVKLDFFDHEAKEVVDLYQVLLRDAAAHRLMVNFHGANKPTGEARTWPNELTREAVSGMERRSMPAWGPHNATLPFTRMLAGHLDFTPLLFSERRKETSHAHQIATAAIHTSPLLVFGAHPRAMLDHPASEMIRSILATWDETRVLPFSRLGEVAGLARRSGRHWFVAVVNGAQARTVEIPLPFLGRGRRHALLVRDRLDDPTAVTIDRTRVGRGTTLSVPMRAGGGFIGRID